jgi:calcium-translocating P-type ATPase
VLLARQLIHFFAVMLWVAAGLALLAGMPQLGIAIAIVVVLNGVFAFVQEYRADQAGERLRELLPEQVTVRRGGSRRLIDAAGLVQGDLVLLSGGDRVCGDMVLTSVSDLAIDESTLTGESVPVRPVEGDRALAGTFVIEGEAEGVVVATGARTRLAEIAAATRQARRPPSPLAVRLHRVVLAVAVIAVIVGATFFALAVLLGMAPADGFLFGVGVTVALVPEGLLPTVTLSLARAAQRMAGRNALVRRLESVETLGSTTFICTDKTGTLTLNQMSVVEVWTRQGTAAVRGAGYDPVGAITADDEVIAAVRELARSAGRCSPGRVARAQGRWRPVGDPMDAALRVLAMRAGLDLEADERSDPALRRFPFDPRRRRSSVLTKTALHVYGAPDSVLPRCRRADGGVKAVAAMSERGLRVLAVARRPGGAGLMALPADEAEHDLELTGLVGLEDPPRDDVASAIAGCHTAKIKIAMVTGDHPGTARAVAAQVGLLTPDSLVLEGKDLPDDDAELGRLLDRDGNVIARVTPEDKLRIARALQQRGHVVAMTGDGVNDGPALRAADIGVAMGASGTDVAREAADLVLLDDHFGTIVAAVELGRATFANIRRFLTYHLTDNVAELTPFVAWALSGGSIPLALTVLQVLALDIGTDLLPALALGAEPPNPRTLHGPPRLGGLIDRPLLSRVFLVLGPVEAVAEMTVFFAVLVASGWSRGIEPSAAVLASASGAAFATVVLGQFANAFACRSETRPAPAVGWRGNRLLLGAVAVEILLLAGFLRVPAIADVLGGSFPPMWAWVAASLVIPLLLVADAWHKRLRRRTGDPGRRVERPALVGANGPTSRAFGRSPSRKGAEVRDVVDDRHWIALARAWRDPCRYLRASNGR